MSGCVDVCPLEAQQQDIRSVGVIEDQEFICRAAYDPIAFKKNKLTAAIVRTKDLFDGTLSVWRQSAKAEMTLQSVVAICQSNTPNQNSLAQVLGVTASTIRNIKIPDIEGRLFCVVDETDTDDAGAYHPAHAHIKICSEVMKGIPQTEDLIFRAIKEQLVIILRQGTAKLYP